MTPRNEAAVGRPMRRLVFTWLSLLLLGALEVAASYLPLARAWRPLIMIPALLMVALVATMFMEVRKGPVIVRAFAVAAVFWLFVLLALGSVDPLTRKEHPVPGSRH